MSFQLYFLLQLKQMVFLTLRIQKNQSKRKSRLKWGKYILDQIGVKSIATKNSIKTYGNPKLSVNKKIIIKNFLKDHRVFMTSVIAALSFGGHWKIHDKFN